MTRLTKFTLSQSPYAMPAGSAKFPGGFMPAGPMPIAAPAYGAVPMLPHMPYAARPPSQIVSIIVTIIIRIPSAIPHTRIYYRARIISRYLRHRFDNRERNAVCFYI